MCWQHEADTCPGNGPDDAAAVCVCVCACVNFFPCSWTAVSHKVSPAGGV